VKIHSITPHSTLNLFFNLQNKYLLVVCFLLGDSPASVFYIPTFRNTLFHLHRQVDVCRMNSAGDMFGVMEMA